MHRSTFLKNLIGLYGIASLPLEMVKQYRKVYLLQCFVRGFQYYEGPGFIKEINKSGLLELVREPDNKYDRNAIALHFNKRKIGFLPMESNEVLSVLLDAQLLEVQAEITRIEPDAAHWEKIRVAVYALKEVNSSKELQNTDPFSLLETPKYYTLKSPKDTYTRIYFEEKEILNGDDFYQALVDNSSNDAIYDLIHGAFANHKEMEEAVNQSRLVINRAKIPDRTKAEELEHMVNGKSIMIKNFFRDSDYFVANVDKIATIPDKIARFEKVLDKTGRVFFEIIFR